MLNDTFLLNQSQSQQYVQFTTGARKGSIARVVKVSVRNTYGKYRYVDSVDVVWDDRPEPLTVYPHRLEWLPNHSGSTHWVFTRTTPKPVFDKLGNELECGMFVAGRSKTKAFVMGTVRELTRAGVVVIETLPTKEGEVSGEARIHAPDMNCLALTEDMMDRIVIAKLTYG